MFLRWSPWRRILDELAWDLGWCTDKRLIFFGKSSKFTKIQSQNWTYYICTGIFCTCLLMEDMGNNAKLLCIFLIWYFHVVMYITSFPKNLQIVTISSHENSAALNPFPGYPLNLAIPKNQGVAWDKHIWSRPTRRNASNWYHWCLRCFWQKFSSLRWAAKCGPESCCLLYPDMGVSENSGFSPQIIPC